MTVQEMIIEVYENSTENTELNPYTAGVFDIAATGAVKCLGYLNRAYDWICSYKDKRSKALKIEELRKILRFQTSVTTGTAQAGTGSSITLASGEVTSNDVFNGYTIYISGGTGSGQTRVIMDSVTGTDVCTINRAWVTALDATSTYTLYKGFFTLTELGLTPNDRILGILKVYDMNEKKEIYYGDRFEDYKRNVESDQVPTKYVFIRNELLFNYPFDTARWYEIEYYGMPTALSLVGDIPVIPAGLHMAMVFYANYIDALKQDDQENAASFFRSAVNIINTAIVDNDILMERQDGNMFIDPQYNRR